MGIFESIIVFLLVWWTSLFTVLPWWVQKNPNPVTGQDQGAPLDPQLKKKFVATTILSFIIWAVIFALVEADVINFHDYALSMMTQDTQK